MAHEPAPTAEELVERLEDWARVLDRAPAFLSKGQYSRIYEAMFRTAADIRQYVARLKNVRAISRRRYEGEPMENKATTAAAANYLELLGLKVRDRVTGFQGIVESISWDLYGCIQAVVRPPVDEKGAMPDGKWCDVLRLEVLDAKPIMAIPGGYQTYGSGPSTTQIPNGAADKPAR